MDAWSNIGFTAHGVHNLTPGESYALCSQGAIIVDVRESYMSNFKMFNVKNVIYLPYRELAGSYSDLPRERLLIFADSVGLRSRDGVLFMNEHGYENAFNMAGGIVDWERDGLPLTIDINNRLSGSCMCQLKVREGATKQLRDEGKKRRDDKRESEKNV